MTSSQSGRSQSGKTRSGPIMSLDNLASLSVRQGRYFEALSLVQRTMSNETATAPNRAASLLSASAAGVRNASWTTLRLRSMTSLLPISF